MSVQIDVGGVWMGVAANGTLGGSSQDRLLLTLPSASSTEQPSATLLPSLASEKIMLTAMPAGTSTTSPAAQNTNGKVLLYGVVIRTVANNISVRLGQFPPFWTRPGALGGPATSPDFAAVLNTFLADPSPRTASTAFLSPFTLTVEHASTSR